MHFNIDFNKTVIKGSIFQEGTCPPLVPYILGTYDCIKNAVRLFFYIEHAYDKENKYARDALQIQFF